MPTKLRALLTEALGEKNYETVQDHELLASSRTRFEVREFTVQENLKEIKTRASKQEKFKVNHLAASKITSFLVSKGVSITTDALALVLKHNIDVVVVERDGHPIGRFWHSKLGSTTKIRKRQLEASLDTLGVQWTKA